MPELFREVKASDYKDNVASAPIKRKIENKPTIENKCSDCELVTDNESKLIVHKTMYHTTTVKTNKKSKSSPKLQTKPKYKILKSDSLKMTVKKAVQQRLDKSVQKLILNESIQDYSPSPSKEVITLEEEIFVDEDLISLF